MFRGLICSEKRTSKPQKKTHVPAEIAVQARCGADIIFSPLLTSFSSCHSREKRCHVGFLPLLGRPNGLSSIAFPIL